MTPRYLTKEEQVMTIDQLLKMWAKQQRTKQIRIEFP